MCGFLRFYFCCFQEIALGYTLTNLCGKIDITENKKAEFNYDM